MLTKLDFIISSSKSTVDPLHSSAIRELVKSSQELGQHRVCKCGKASVTDVYRGRNRRSQLPEGTRVHLSSCSEHSSTTTSAPFCMKILSSSACSPALSRVNLY